MMLVVRILPIQSRRPLFHSVDDFGRVVLAQLHLRSRPHIVFRRLEQRQQSVHRFAKNLRRRQQRTTFVGNAVDAAVLLVAVGVADVMLQMADELLTPVEEIDRAVRGTTDGGGAEVRVVGFDQVFQRLPFQSAPFFRHLHPKNPLKADDVKVEEIPLPVLREMPAADHARAGTGPVGAGPKLRHGRVLLRVREIAAEGGGEEVLVARRVRDDVIPPAVENAAMRVGKAVADVLLEFAGQRLIAEDAAVVAADDAGPRFHLGAVEDAVAEIRRPAGIEHHRVGRVVRVGGVDSHQHPLLPVRLVVAVGVPDKPQIGSLHQQHAVFEKRKACRAVQIVDKVFALVGPAIAVGVLKNQDRVPDGAGRRPLGIALPSGDPQPPLRVPGHLHRADQLGELLLAGEEVDLASFRHGHAFDRLFRPEIRRQVLAVGHELRNGRQVGIVDGLLAPLGDGPNMLVAVLGQRVPLLHLLLHDLEVGDLRPTLPRLVTFLGAAAVDVVAIDGAVAGVPLLVLLQNGGPQLLQGLRVPLEQRSIRQERPLDGRREHLIAVLGEVHAVKRVRLGRAAIRLFRNGEQVHKWHLIRLCHFGHRRGIQLEIGVGHRRVRQVRVIQLLNRQRRKDNQPRWPLAAVVFLQRLLDERIQVGFELRQPRLSGERFVAPEHGENDIRFAPHQPFFRAAKILRPVPERQLIPGDCQIAKHQILIRKPARQQRLQPAMMLHPVAERVADDADAVTLFELKGLCRCYGGDDQQRNENNYRGQKRLHRDTCGF